jgi:hypothetical protein
MARGPANSGEPFKGALGSFFRIHETTPVRGYAVIDRENDAYGKAIVVACASHNPR